MTTQADTKKTYVLDGTLLEACSCGGQRLSPLIGIVLLGLAVLWLAHPVWLLSGIGV